MDFVDGGFVSGLRHDPIGQEDSDDVTGPRGERLLHSPRARVVVVVVDQHKSFPGALTEGDGVE